MNDRLSIEQLIREKINQRRRQMLVHSCIYYVFDENIVSDATWSRWAMELVDLQKAYPEIANDCVYSDAFKDFDGSTGFHLPVRDPWVIGTAERLLDNRKEAN